jgi:hypothetical protein
MGHISNGTRYFVQHPVHRDRASFFLSTLSCYGFCSSLQSGVYGICFSTTPGTLHGDYDLFQDFQRDTAADLVSRARHGGSLRGSGVRLLS